RLATRLREAGMKVIGLGAKKTPTSFISACEKFIYLEILRKQQPAAQQRPTGAKGQKQQPVEVEVPTQTETLNKVDNGLIRLISESIHDVEDEDGWAFLGELGSLLLKKQPDFDPRNYGFNKMLPLIKSINRFEVDERD